MVSKVQKIRKDDNKSVDRVDPSRKRISSKTKLSQTENSPVEEDVLQENDEVIEIRKYANRRLYCKNLSEYVVLEDVANMIKDGKRVVVKDATTGKDLTRLILTQIILEAEGKDNNPLLPLSFLEALIGLYGNGINHFLLPKFLEQSIKTFEDSTNGFENYLDKLFDDVPGGNPMHYSLMSPLKDMNNMNKKLLSINKEIMRNSMQMMMGEGWSPSFEKEMFPEENSDMAISQKRLRKRLLKRDE